MLIFASTHITILVIVYCRFITNRLLYKIITTAWKLGNRKYICDMIQAIRFPEKKYLFIHKYKY